MIPDQTLIRLAKLAWDVREKAYVLGPTKVGCALITPEGNTYGGCNVEHRFRSHDVHAEVNAITSMVAVGEQLIVALVIAAERDFFTPCGACMDWIMQFADGDCVIAFQSERGGRLQKFHARELMPYYPI